MLQHRFFIVPLMILLSSTSLAWGRGKDEKKVSRPYLGVLVGPAEEGKPGLLVREVTANSPAAKAGLKPGDQVIKIDDKDVTDMGMFLKSIGDRKPGDKVNFKVVRDGKEQNLEAVLGERPAETAPP